MNSYRNRITIAIAVSLLLHLATLWMYASTQIIQLLSRVLSRPVTIQQTSKKTSQAVQAKSLQQQPLRRVPQLNFIEVDATQASLQKPKDPKFFSDRSSLVANPVPSTKSADIPKIEGRKIDNLQTTTVRRPTPNKLATTQPKSTPSRRAQPPQPKPQPAPAKTTPAPAPKPSSEGITAPTLLAKVAPVAPAPQPSQQLKLREPAPSNEEMPQFNLVEPQLTPRSEMQSTRADREIPTTASQTQGGVERRGPVALNVIGLPHGAYSKKMFAAIGKRWTLLMEQYYADGQAGKVKLEFVLHPDGRVDHLTVAQNTGAPILASFCQKSVIDSAPFDPWPDELKLLGGNHLDITIEFSVYVY